jgi:MoaA/NifB/PqqE/SkfB family radical SAM enzyme
MSFARLQKHLEDEDRRRQLLEIEKNLVEHPFPPQLVIENTSWCNLTCIHCAHRDLQRPHAHMPRALWDKLVEEVGRTSPDCEVWPTFYGEALLLGNELWDRLGHAARVGCRNLVLNSNGTALGAKDNIERVLASPLRRFILSLDGLSQASFEKIRRKAKWHKVYPAVEELCRRRLERGITYPTITAQFSVMPDNAHEVEDFRAYWSALGAEVKVRPMMEWTASGAVATETIIHGHDFRIACPWANNTMAIHQDGRVVTCAVDYEGFFVVGNASDMSIAEAWRLLRDKVRSPHREHRWDDMPEVCRRCGDWQTAGAQYETSTVEGTRPFWFRNE